MVIALPKQGAESFASSNHLQNGRIKGEPGSGTRVNETQFYAADFWNYTAPHLIVEPLWWLPVRLESTFSPWPYKKKQVTRKMPKHQKVDDMTDGCNASATAYTTRSTGHTCASPRATWFLLKDQSFLLCTHKHQWRDKGKHQMHISTQKKELLSFLFMFWGPKSTQLPTFWTSECTQHLSNHPFLSTPWHLQDVESSTRWPNPRKCRNLSCFQHVQSTHLCFKRSIFLSIDYC